MFSFCLSLSFISLGTCSSVLSCFVLFYFIFLMLIRVLDCLNAMNMHMNINMNWCIGVVLQ